MKNFSLLHVALMTVFVSSTPVSFAEYVDSTQLTPQNQDLEVSDGNLENPDRTYAVYWGNKHKLKILASDISATAKRNAIWVNTSSYADIGNNGNVHLIAGSETSSLKNINTLFAETDSTINLYGKNVIIDAISDGTQSVNAIKAKLAGSDLPSSITIGSEQTESISINAKGNHSSFGILNLGSSINLQANDVSIKSSGHGIGNNAVTPQPSLSSFTTVKANNVSIDAEGYGITNNGSKLEIEANTLTINSGMGMHVGNSTSDKEPTGSDYATTTIIANQTTINAETHGILAFSNGIVDISGNLTVNAPIAIDVRGYSTVNINQGGQSTVVLNGDISFETPGGENQSGSDIDAYVNINLTGAGSSWTGNVKKEYPATAEGDDSTSVTGLKLSLSNGAQWNPTIIDDWSEDFGGTTLVGTVQALNNLNLDGGIINLSHGSDQTVNVENLTGSGGTVNLLTTVGSDGTLSTGGINFAKVEGVPFDLILPLHGVLFRKPNDIQYIIRKYDTWSSYESEEKGVLIVYGSIYGNTAKAANILAKTLSNAGVKNIFVRDSSIVDNSFLLSDAFKYSHLIVLSSSYNAGVFPKIEEFMLSLKAHNYQNRKVAFIENGSWAPSAYNSVKDILNSFANCKLYDKKITILSTLSKDNLSQFDDLVSFIKEDFKEVDLNSINTSFNIPYGLYLCTSAKEDNSRVNGCIINTFTQISDPNIYSVSLNRTNYTTKLILKSKKIIVSVLNQDTPMDLIKRFGFQSGAEGINKFEGFNDFEIDKESNLPYISSKYSNSYFVGEVINHVELEEHVVIYFKLIKTKALNNSKTLTYSYYQSNIKPVNKSKGTNIGWRCKICGYLYKGENLPKDFVCPWCKHGPNDFEKVLY